jgi:hypothetical protein
MSGFVHLFGSVFTFTYKIAAGVILGVRRGVNEIFALQG